MNDLISKAQLFNKLATVQTLGEAFAVIQSMETVERHEFHVIDTKTGEKADMEGIALGEDWARNLVYCDMESFAIEEDGTLILMDECGNTTYCPPERFEIVWD